MIAYIVQNLSTILISGVILAVVVLICKSLLKKKKAGISIGCGCGCDNCPSASLCHKN